MLSNNTDEAVYLFQADTLLKGKLWLENTQLSPFFMTWFTKLYGDKIVFKYTPVHAAILAAGKYLTGHFELALYAIAVATTLSMYVFCREILRTRTTALLATFFLLVSPLWLIQSATYLPYCSFLALILCFAALCARGLRKHNPALLACSGLVLGIALFARPYDALIFGAAWLLFYPVWKLNWRRQLGLCAWIGAGVAPCIALIMLFNASTTGDPLLFPFKQDELDTFGFGLKQVFEGVGYSYFDFDSLLESTREALWQLVLWNFGGIIMLVLAAGYILRKKLRRPDYALLAILVAFPAGYSFFWGMHNLMVWGALYYLGPYYFLPCMVPLSIYAARAMRILLRFARKFIAVLWRYRREATAAALLIIMPLVSLYMLYSIIEGNLAFTAKFDAMYRPFHDNADIAPKDNVVFVPPAYGKYLLHPFRMLSNTGEHQDTFIYAVNRGGENFALFDSYPDHTFLRYDVFGPYSENPGDINDTRLVPLELEDSRQKILSLHAVTPRKTRWVRFCIAADDKPQCFVDAPSHSGAAYDIKIRVTPQAVTLIGVTAKGAKLPVKPLQPLVLHEGQPLQLRADFSYSDLVRYSPRSNHTVSYEYRYFIRKKDKGLQSIEPPEQWEHNDRVKNWFITNANALTLK
jgi:hypothetical protein